jgi:hypothetical protein
MITLLDCNNRKSDSSFARFRNAMEKEIVNP